MKNPPPPKASVPPAAPLVYALKDMVGDVFCPQCCEGSTCVILDPVLVGDPDLGRPCSACSAFWVPIRPAPKGNRSVPIRNPRTGKLGVIPCKSASKKERALIAALRNLNPRNIPDGPLSVGVWFVYPICKSWNKTKKASAKAGTLWPTTRNTSERSNLTKLFDDALERSGIVNDDSAIVAGEVRKVYGPVAGYRFWIRSA